MTDKSSCLISLMTLLALAPPVSAEPVRYYVSESGNDQWSGTSPEAKEAGEGPFTSIERARDEIRKTKPTDGAIVSIRGGAYELHQTLKFGPEDSNTTYAAYENEKPTIIGGHRLTNFVPHKGEILKADVAAQGFKGVQFRQLFFNGVRQHLARRPNFDPQNPYGGGWAYVDGALVSKHAVIPGEDNHSLRYKEGDVQEWARPEEAEVFVFPRYNWFNNIVPIKAIDRQARMITLAADTSYPVRPGDRYFVRNVFEELDAPGEWYLDARDGTLYFWPPEALEGAIVYAPLVENLIEVAGASNVIFRGLTLECADAMAISLKDCTTCVIAGNNIRNVGADANGVSAVRVWGGERCGIVGNDIYDVGYHGVWLDGGDRKTLAPSGHYADNNYIHHVGVFLKHGNGIELTGVGNRAAHNLIHDCPRMGIEFYGNNIVVEYNHVRHVNIETEDTGLIYTGGRNWINSRGSIIRHNYFHDSLGYGRNEAGEWTSPHHSWGIYLDDTVAGVDVVGNIVVRCPRALVHFHNARDNVVENNILVDGALFQVEYNGWVASGADWIDGLPAMVKGYESTVGQPAWEELRGSKVHPNDGPAPNGMTMTGNVFRRNIVAYRNPAAWLFVFNNLPLERYESDYNLIWPAVRPPRMQAHLIDGQNAIPDDQQWEAWRKQGFDRHSVVADPMFVDAAQDDYRLKADSPAFELGFQPIPTEKIGPYADAMRASWPIVEAEGVREKPPTTNRR